MRLAFYCLAGLSLLCPGGYAERPVADTIFTNGNVYTVDSRQPRAEAIAVKAGKVLFVGSNTETNGYRGAATKVVDLKGATVVPGLTDSHYHIEGVGAR